MRIILTFLMIFVLQACNQNATSDKIQASQVTAKDAAAAPNAKKPSGELDKKEAKAKLRPEAKPEAAEKPEEKPKLTGEKLAAKLNTLTIQDPEFNEHIFKDYVVQGNKKHKILLFVKPHCIYCETLLATIEAEQSKHKPNADLYIVMDAKHATTDEFKAKYNDSRKIDAKWIYDAQTQVVDTLDIDAFPRFVITDDSLKVIKDQRGLMLPENREKLKGMQLPELLRSLCETTYEWMIKQ
jgi:thioredoxin-related protein